MSVDRDAWIFGLIVSGLAVAFTMPLLLEQGSVWSVVFVCLLFGLPAGVGYFIGYLRRRIPVGFKALFFAAGFAYLVTDSIARLFSFYGEQWYVSTLIIFIISVMLGWRLPDIVSKEISKKASS